MNHAVRRLAHDRRCLVMGLGAFGVVTQVTVQNSALTRVQKRTEVLPLEQAAEGLRLIQDREVIGKIVVTP